MYHAMNEKGVPRMGDPIFDENMRAEVDRIGGYVIDDEGVVVYESPAFLARVEAEK